jgi:hypothetical protein
METYKVSLMHPSKYVKIKDTPGKHKILYEWWNTIEKSHCYFLEGQGCWPARSLEKLPTNIGTHLNECLRLAYGVLIDRLDRLRSLLLKSPLM